MALSSISFYLNLILIVTFFNIFYTKSQKNLENPFFFFCRMWLQTFKGKGLTYEKILSFSGAC